MRPRTLGYRWKEGKEVVPAIISAFDVTSEYVQKINIGRCSAWVIDYTYTGHGRYRVKTPKMKLRDRRRNTAHVYAHDTAYWEDTRKVTGHFHNTWIIMNGGDQAGLKALIGKYDFARFLDPTEQLGNFISAAAGIGQKYGEHGYWRAQALLCRIIHMLLNAEPGKGENYTIQHEDKLVHVSDFVREAELYMRNNLTRKVRLNKLADVMRMSVSALSHRFRRETGETPIAMQHRMRIDYAKELIMRGYLLKEIANELGYTDEFHLSKTFKKVTGKSPRSFRKSLQTL